jgi:acetone carboxylase gamma subunit
MKTCFFGHHWEHWSKPVKIAMRRTHQSIGNCYLSLDAPLEYHQWRQDRLCKRCGLSEFREVAGS